MKDIAIVDPYPRTMELIFSKPKLNDLKNKFKLIFAPVSYTHLRAHET